MVENKFIKGFLILIVIGLCFSLSFAQQEQNANYLIQPGDVIKITVLGEEDLFREIRVSSSGSITYPLLEELYVKGITSHDLEKLLTRQLNEFLVNPQVSVFISEFGKIFVYGEVVRPGAFELSDNISLLESITLAGGLSKYANRKKIKVISKSRDDKKVIEIDLTSITEKGKKENDIDLQPGDVVFVPESFL